MKFLRILALLLVFSPLVRGEDMEDGAIIETPPPPMDPGAVDVPPPDVAVPLPEGTVIAPTPSATADAAVAPAPVPVTVVSPSPVEGATPPSISVDAGAHRVVTGDTLWDLAGSYLRDPFQWTRIYEANRSRITNPDLIYPDQELVIPSVDAAAALEAPAEVPAPVVEETAPVAAPETVVAEETPPAAEPAVEETAMAEEPAPAVNEAEEIAAAVSSAKKKASSASGAGFMGGVADTFIADENWEYDGYIIRDRELKMMISQGDVVYLNVGASAGVKSKMVANVFRVGRKVKDPYLKKPTGRLVKRVGTVVITGHISDEGCTAVVTNSLEPIRIGDIVKFLTR